MKTILVSIPALIIAATVTMVGCGDDTTTQDLTVVTTKDLSVAQDLSKKD
jgi:hypothetical protein